MKEYYNRDLIVYCDRASGSARTIAEVLGCRRWFEFSTPGCKTAPVVPCILNWGASDKPLWISKEHWPWPNGLKYHMLNDVEPVADAINKLSTLEALKKAGVPCLDFVIFPEARVPESEETVLGRWLAEDGKYIARMSLTGSGGRGLRVVGTPEGFVKAPLYTRYYPKTHEFRVHVFRGEVIDFTQKRLKPELIGNADRLVRSHENGWVHSHELDEFVTTARPALQDGALAACKALQLDFGAIDLLARFSTKKLRPLKDFKVCEINTGPGLENTKTIQAYSDAVDKWYYSLKNRHCVRPTE